MQKSAFEYRGTLCAVLEAVNLQAWGAYAETSPGGRGIARRLLRRPSEPSPPGGTAVGAKALVSRSSGCSLGTQARGIAGGVSQGRYAGRGTRTYRRPAIAGGRD